MIRYSAYLIHTHIAVASSHTEFLNDIAFHVISRILTVLRALASIVVKHDAIISNVISILLFDLKYLLKNFQI